jgi:hypothetical protein
LWCFSIVCAEKRVDVGINPYKKDRPISRRTRNARPYEV